MEVKGGKATIIDSNFHVNNGYIEAPFTRDAVLQVISTDELRKQAYSVAEVLRSLHRTIAEKSPLDPEYAVPTFDDETRASAMRVMNELLHRSGPIPRPSLPPGFRSGFDALKSGRIVGLRPLSGLADLLESLGNKGPSAGSKNPQVL
jgi:hypothetical protein